MVCCPPERRDRPVVGSELSEQQVCADFLRCSTCRGANARGASVEHAPAQRIDVLVDRAAKHGMDKTKAAFLLEDLDTAKSCDRLDCRPPLELGKCRRVPGIDGVPQDRHRLSN